MSCAACLVRHAWYRAALHPFLPLRSKPGIIGRLFQPEPARLPNAAKTSLLSLRSLPQFHRRPGARPAFACLLAALAIAAVPQVHADLLPAQISADGVPQPLTASPGDAAQGRALLLARENANCILCHAIPEARFSGNLGPPLDGVGTRLSAAQLRLRVADNARVKPSTIMPSYFRSEGLIGVAAQYRGKTVLTAQEVEDVVAYLRTLK